VRNNKLDASFNPEPLEMTPLLVTISLSFVIILIALTLLGIGWLITGKCKIQPGACGRDPTKKQAKGDSCGDKVSCQLCEHGEKKEPPSPQSELETSKSTSEIETGKSP
jgi:hypothetical protein